MGLFKNRHKKTSHLFSYLKRKGCFKIKNHVLRSGLGNTDESLMGKQIQNREKGARNKKREKFQQN